QAEAVARVHAVAPGEGLGDDHRIAVQEGGPDLVRISLLELVAGEPPAAGAEDDDPDRTLLCRDLHPPDRMDRLDAGESGGPADHFRIEVRAGEPAAPA